MPSQISFPWVKPPLIANAPMGGIAKSKLASAVSAAGGLGFIGAISGDSSMTTELEAVHDYFTSENDLGNLDFNNTSLDVLPVGMGVLVFVTSLEAVLEAVRKVCKPPAVIWLFGANDPDPTAVYAAWTSGLREAFPDSQIWIQVGGGVKVAVETVQKAKPDVLVVQGNDAGGHGAEVGASLLSVLPEVIDTLRSDGINIPVVAAGGIVEARGALAAFTLGAAGVVLGTRYLASWEVTLPHPEYQKRIIAASDGAVSTVRAKVFDELKGPNIWPAPYDGRALVSASYKDWKAGVSSDDIVSRMKKETDRGEEGDMGFGVTTDRAAIWAGSGVGLVKGVLPAAQITREIRNGIYKELKGLESRL